MIRKCLEKFICGYETDNIIIYNNLSCIFAQLVVISLSIFDQQWVTLVKHLKMYRFVLNEILMHKNMDINRLFLRK